MTPRIPALLALGVAGCIIPDRGIGFEGEFDNEGAVRIVQPTPLPSEMLDICNEPEADLRDSSYCPQVPHTIHSGLIGRPADAPFCVCPSGADTRVLPEFFIYAEDPDRAQDEPIDALYAVALLDFDPTESDDPQNAVAYREQLPPGTVGELVRDRNIVTPEFSAVAASDGREDNLLWQFRFGKNGGGGTDLCNDNGGISLTPGLHGITVMITDRPFLRPPLLGVDGEPIVDQSGNPVLAGTQYGMPDLAIGATYAVANWVFECKDPMVDEACACEEAG
jgi:hypothetical protein